MPSTRSKSAPPKRRPIVRRSPIVAPKKSGEFSTVRRAELANISMVGGNERFFTRVVLDGKVSQWVGFGWVDEGPAVDPRDNKLPRVVG